MRRLQRKLEEFAGPRWPRKIRLMLVLGVVTAGYVCYRWRLLHAWEFGALGAGFFILLLFIRRAIWKRRSRPAA